MKSDFQKRILVTGGLGFIASNFLNKFVLKYPNHLFINVDCLTYAGNPKNISVSKNANYFFEKKDIRDLQAMEKVFKKHKPTDIIHFAAESHVDFSIKNPSIFIETNVLGTHNLLSLSVKYGVQRFHQVSTDEVYGSLGKKDSAFRKESPLLPNSPYSASKASADLLVRSYNKTFGLNTVITRCSNNYGPNQDKSKLIPKVINNALKNKRIPVYGKGENVRDWIYVEDHIDAIDLVFRKGKNGEIYNIGGENEFSNIGIIKKILKMLGKSESLIQFVEDRKGHDFRYSIDNSEIERELDWRPKVPFSLGLQKTINFYKSGFMQ